jgi:hypothetical protein
MEMHVVHFLVRDAAVVLRSVVVAEEDEIEVEVRGRP